MTIRWHPAGEKRCTIPAGGVGPLARGKQAGAARSLAVVGLLALALLGAACKSAPSDALPPERKPASVEVWNYPKETYGDPSLGTEPRLQFVWKTPPEKDLSIFSVRLDGKDIRRVVGPELLRSNGMRGPDQTPQRSPDGRYIACAGEDEQGEPLRYLVDRKTQTVKTMMAKTYGAALFNWMPDSKSVIFYGDLKLWRFDVETGERTELPMVYSNRLFLVNGGKTFIAYRKSSSPARPAAIEEYDRQGKRLRVTPLPFENGAPLAVTADGGLFAFALPTDKLDPVVIPIDRPERIVKGGPSHCLDAAFGPDGRILYCLWSTLEAWDLASGRVTSLGPFPGTPPSDLTLVNAGHE